MVSRQVSRGVGRQAGFAVAAVAAVAAIGGAFVAGSVWAGGGVPPGPGPEELRLTGSGELLPPTEDCGELLDVYVDRALDLVGPWGWGSARVALESSGDAVDSARATADAAGEAEGSASSAPAMHEATSSPGGTNVQEAGVDEPDVVKTDGEHLYRIQDGRLTAYDVTGSTPVEVGELSGPGLRGGQLLLAGDTIVVVAGRDGADRPRELAQGSTRVLQIDVSDPSDLVVSAEREWDADLVTARMHGSTVRVLTAAGLPDLPFTDPGDAGSTGAAEDHNRELVRDTGIEDWLPTDAAGDPLVGCGDVHVPDSDSGVDTLAVVGFDAGDLADTDATGILTDSEVAYLSTDRLTVATPAYTDGCCELQWDLDRPLVARPGGTTHLHSFALDGTATRHVASGEVEGAVRDRWSMDSHDGVLRLAVGPTNRTGNFNSVVTLVEQGDRLVEAGRVDRLGVDEEIKSVRWFDELAVVVTFRTTDPLYAVDLRSPREPELLGELKIPGFTQYLHPLGEDLMIGVGQDADPATGRTLGAQAALFDLSDMSSPERVSTIGYPKGSEAGAATDPRQFTWLPGRRTALAVVHSGWGRSPGRTGWVSVLAVRDRELHERRVEVAHGDDVDLVRLVPLPADDAAGAHPDGAHPGRVVLVTPDDVRFLPL